MKILIDTNVIIDYLAKRVPHYANAYKIIDICLSGGVDGFLAAHSVTNAFYILSKGYSSRECREMLLEMCNIFGIVEIDRDKIMSCLKKDNFRDFEDCLQSGCAAACGADFIVTRNVKDFSESTVKAVSPEDFLKLF